MRDECPGRWPRSAPSLPGDQRLSSYSLAQRSLVMSASPEPRRVLPLDPNPVRRLPELPHRTPSPTIPTGFAVQPPVQRPTTPDRASAPAVLSPRPPSLDGQRPTTPDRASAPTVLPPRLPSLAGLQRALSAKPSIVAVHAAVRLRTAGRLKPPPLPQGQRPLPDLPAPVAGTGGDSGAPSTGGGGGGRPLPKLGDLQRKAAALQQVQAAGLANRVGGSAKSVALKASAAAHTAMVRQATVAPRPPPATTVCTCAVNGHV